MQLKNNTLSMEYECTKYFEQPRGYLQGENENEMMIYTNVSKNVCTLSPIIIIKSEVWLIWYCLG